MKSDLHKAIWAVMTPTNSLTGLTHAHAWKLANRLREEGEQHATVITAAAAQRRQRTTDN